MSAIAFSCVISIWKLAKCVLTPWAPEHFQLFKHRTHSANFATHFDKPAGSFFSHFVLHIKNIVCSGFPPSNMYVYVYVCVCIFYVAIMKMRRLFCDFPHMCEIACRCDSVEEKSWLQVGGWEWCIRDIIIKRGMCSSSSPSAAHYHQHFFRDYNKPFVMLPRFFFLLPPSSRQLGKLCAISNLNISAHPALLVGFWRLA